MYTRNLNILLVILFTILNFEYSYCQDLIQKDSTGFVNDSILPEKKDSQLQSIINYKAKDHVSLKARLKQIFMYNESEIQTDDMTINSGVIVMDYGKDVVNAGGLKDTLNNYEQYPNFIQGNQKINPDSLVFNTKSKKALIFNSRTEQQGGTVIANKTKRVNDSVYFISNGKFTTSENLDDPEYYILMNKAKVVPNKKIVTGFANMYIYDVPTPVAVPFAYFPLTNKRTSGVIFPTFGQASENLGFSLQNGGYYLALSDYYDMTFTGDMYTNGSYGVRIDNAYALKYKFRGRFNFRYENLINGERGFPDYSRRNIYNLQWSHSQDTKSNPSSRFSASVNLGSSTYYQNSVNQFNQSNFLNNTLASSVSYSKTFQGEPQVNLSLTATHSQNTQTQQINMSLPTFQGSIGRVFPFAPKSGTKKGIIDNINLQFNTRAENRIQTTDSLFFKKEMFDEAKIGARHSIPISTNFKVLKYLSLTAGTSLNETWTMNTVSKEYDVENNEVLTHEKNNFERFATYNFNSSLGTTLYGMYNFKNSKRNPKIQAIRHVLRPSVSYNINPSFDKFYDSYEVISADGTTKEEIEYTKFENSIYGSPNKNFSSSMGLSLSNNIEAKVRDDDPNSKEEFKKIKLLNALNFSTSYNFAADSLKLSPVRISGGTTILNNKMNINFGGTLDPYALNSDNQRIDKLNIDNNGSLFRLTSANINTGYTLNNDIFKRKGKSKTEEAAIDQSIQSGGRADDLFGKPQDFNDRKMNSRESLNNEEEQEAFNFSIPWSLRLAYAVNYSNSARQNEISSHSLMFSGDVDLSPRWQVGVSSGYDLKQLDFTYTQLRFERDLLSWKMNFSWVPFGPRTSWNFFIGIKSSLLQDLKYDKRKMNDRQL